MKIKEKAIKGYVKAGNMFITAKENEKGMGTIEILLIIAVLISLAFLFNGFIVEFFGSLTDGIKGSTSTTDIINGN